MAARPQLTGLRFGRFYVSGFYASEGGSRLWSCICDCGTLCVVPTTKLVTGTKLSCGCLHREVTAGLRRTHGKSKTSEYNVWLHIKRRCLDPTNPAYVNYGGRGIKVCPRWVLSFENFSSDMGPRPVGGTLDRIDNNGNYEPGNCRWATRTVQNRNRRDNVVVTVDGITASLAAHCERTGVKYSTALYRLRAGYPPDVAVANVSLRTATYRAKRRELEKEQE